MICSSESPKETCREDRSGMERSGMQLTGHPTCLFRRFTKLHPLFSEKYVLFNVRSKGFQVALDHEFVVVELFGEGCFGRILGKAL